MTEYRVARPEEQAALTFFGSMVFSMDGEKTDFETLIPKEYAKERSCAEHHLLAVNEQGIRGMIATLPGVMRVGKLELKTGYVGTVSVHPQARGEGHMKKLMELSLTRMRENGTDISMLGGRRQRYAYFGYESGGLEYHADFRPYTVRQAMAEVDAEGFSFTPVQPGSEEEALALKLQESQPCWVDREPFGFAAAAASYTCGAWAARKDGKFAGYLVSNGEKNSVSELVAAEGFGPDALVKAWFLQNGLERLTVTIPGWNRPLMARLSRYAEGMNLTPCEKIHILRYRPVIEALLTLKGRYTPLADGELALEADGQTVTVTVKNGAVCVTDGGEDPWKLTHREIHELLLSPFALDLQDRAPRGWFPLPWHTPVADTF